MQIEEVYKEKTRRERKTKEKKEPQGRTSLSIGKILLSSEVRLKNDAAFFGGGIEAFKVVVQASHAL